MIKEPLMVGLGEVLWDRLPSGKVLGGAPANFACMASALGDRGVVASRVGRDGSGDEALVRMEELGVDTQFVQRDQEHETGYAEVAIDGAGQPIFTIKESVAWDHLEWTSTWEELASLADVVCFGSLAQRSPISAATIDRFLRHVRADAIRVLDVNLRQPYFTRDVLKHSLERATIVKLTDEELGDVTQLLGLQADGDERRARWLLHAFNLKLVCITRGARGSVLVSHEETVEHPGCMVSVVDSIGAGDAFTASLAHHLVRGRSLHEINDFSNRLASWVATQVGATPVLDRALIERMTSGRHQEIISR